MDIAKYERRLESLVRKKKKYFEKDSESGNAFQELHPNSPLNRKRELFKRICMLEYGLSSYEFFNRLIDFAMEHDQTELLDKILEK